MKPIHALLMAACCVLAGQVQAADASRPNIVIILVDDKY